jgi:branched-chain amino acid aminotransferase
MYYHVNGEVVPAEEATVSVRDRGFLYGDAAFETLRAYGGSIFEREAHLERLRNTCETLGMGGAVPADLPERIEEALAANDLAEAYVRVSVTRGTQPGKLTPRPEVTPSVIVIVDSLPRGGREGPSVWDDPATVATVATRAIPDAALPAGAKTHNYLNGILARLELRDSESATAASATGRTDGTDVAPSTDTDGQRHPVDEALLHEESGAITEGATSNVFFVSDGVLRTPSAEGPLLPGITRSVVLDLAASEGIPTETGSYTPAECRAAEECFLTNTTWELRPVTRFDGREIPAGDGKSERKGGPITRQLADAFDALVERRHY